LECLFVYFTAIKYILWPFGIFCGRFWYFSRFVFVLPRKIWLATPAYTLRLSIIEQGFGLIDVGRNFLP
jgi:hypothetical protein